ncbi:disease resistance protein RPS5-like [Syzygium oleosum]|uniref:disease resistance protein RPS5-like n=1 Tax=Syzygium oleosum TaxID=219896 RepID=UPI0024B99383|nr:disease resistance protein RPS5-like [Syzygium oleosum]
MIECVTASYKTVLSIIELYPFAGSQFFDLSPPKKSMECANPLSDLVKCLWGLARKPLCSIYNLKDNVDSLNSATANLKAKSEDVKARVKCEEDGGGVQRTNQVASWLDSMQEFEGRVDQVRQEAEERDRIKCLSRCLPRHCWSSYQLGETVDRMLIEASKLQTEAGQFGILTMPLPPPSVINIPVGETVGLDSALNKAWKWLVDEKQARVIGLYGPGGVGKTTLMKKINEKLSHPNPGFDIVIWVVVSKQVNEDSIRDAMRKRLGLTGENWNGWSPDDRVHYLWEALTKKKFVLLIDDVWARLDLSKIGVSHPVFENGSKVVFTTRSKEVCSQMGADNTSFKVQCLTTKEALVLFENNVGKSIANSHPEIQDLAKDIVQECEGLPLALITVGRAMAGIDKPHEWKDALTKLKKNPYKLSGMEEEVYRILEFSYDKLNDSTLQRCFLYCCLFPEDYHIRLHDLIGLWIGEGLLGDTDDVYSLRNEGEHVLGRLNRACLLESGHDGREYVKMHDVIRDMATWIARDHGQRESKLLVIEREEDMSKEMISKWGEAKKVTIQGEWIRNINQIPSRCSQLETLFVRKTRVTVLPSGFFDSMTACLAVLNLSDNRHIKSFPEGICNLINLQYLNLSGTGISELPKEIKNLTRLRWLLLDDMLERNIFIPRGAITSLPLNVFSQWESKDHWEECGLVKEEETVEELVCMQHLTDLSICVRESSSAQKIFQSPNLRRRIRRAYIDNMKGNLTSIVITYSPTSTDNFSHLETLYLSQCTKLSEMKITQEIGQAPNCSCFPNLVEVYVDNCRLSDLSWLVHAPKLRKLIVVDCQSMERIIGDGFAREELADSGLFSRLEYLALVRLPKLTSICDQTLSFPQGVSFVIFDCPGLRKLPLDSSSARGSFEVLAGKDWWAGFEWDPTDRVTLQLGGEGPVEEMIFGEAARKVKDVSRRQTKIGFLPRGGPSE